MLELTFLRVLYDKISWEEASVMIAHSVPSEIPTMPTLGRKVRVRVRVRVRVNPPCLP